MVDAPKPPRPLVSRLKVGLMDCLCDGGDFRMGAFIQDMPNGVLHAARRFLTELGSIQDFDIALKSKDPAWHLFPESCPVQQWA